MKMLNIIKFDDILRHLKFAISKYSTEVVIVFIVL